MRNSRLKAPLGNGQGGAQVWEWELSRGKRGQGGDRGQSAQALPTWVKNLDFEAQAGVAQWIECRPANQSVTGSIPCQDTCLGCGPGPQ